MKKLILSVTMCLAVLLACDNEVIENYSIESRLNTKSVCEIDTTGIINITENIWHDLMSSRGEFIKYENPKNIYRMAIEERLAKGYISCLARDGKENLKARFSQSSCEQMGVPYGIYIVDFCEAKIKINLATGEQFLYVDVSPNCGFKPDMESTRGYAMTMTGNVVILTTYLTHIKYDMLGKNINKWWPITPNNLEWNYKILVP